MIQKGVAICEWPTQKKVLEQLESSLNNQEIQDKCAREL
jgi:hypothetical protein